MDKEYLKKAAPLVIIAILSILLFFMIKPIAIPILGGLILAYLFFPVYIRLVRYLRNETVAALLSLALAIVIFVLPLWFIIPRLINQVFSIFTSLQNFNARGLIHLFFPTASDQFAAQISAALDGFFSKMSSIILNYLADFLVNSIVIFLGLFIASFVLFYALRESDKINRVIIEISSFGKGKGMNLTKQFKDITNSLIYGQLLVGIVQGVLAGIGLIVFGVPNALVLSLTAVLLSIIPIVGPWPVWIPAAIYLFTTGNPVFAVIFLLYNLLFVSTVDNFLRTSIISRKMKISQGLVFIGIMGGLFVFGLLGLIIGPLIISYLITFIEASLAEAPSPNKPSIIESVPPAKKEEKKQASSSKPFYFLKRK